MMGIGYQELLVFFVLVIPYFLATVALVPCVASANGRSGFEWLLIALLVTPLLALIALAAMPVKREDQPDGSEIPEFKWKR